MYIIIPAYEPDKRLIQVVQDITIKLPKARIIVVNDGSGPGYNDYYDETAFIGATVLTHPVNKGKGAALKTAFAHIQEEVVSQHLSAQPIVTVDSDGQHLIKDIVRVAKQPRKIQVILSWVRVPLLVRCQHVAALGIR